MIHYDETGRSFHLGNGRMSYAFRLAGGKYPLHLYWGRGLRGLRNDLPERLCAYTDDNFSLNELPLDLLPQECPVFGNGDMREGMLAIRLENGDDALDLCYASHRIVKGKPPLANLPSARGEDAETLYLTLTDAPSGVSAELSYTIYPDIDILVRSVRVINGGSSPVVIRKALSASVDFEKARFDLLTLSGAWLREREMFRRPLVPGEQGVGSLRGASGHQSSPFLSLLAPGATEDAGEVYALSLCYSGNFQAQVQLDQHGMARATIGIHPQRFSWRLEPGEAFQAPEAYLCYSDSGLNGMSRNFHSLLKDRITGGRYARARRPILINNWEATYFDFSEEKLLALARRAKEAGIELFVLDDGWFGHRNSDNSSLGDWFDNPDKLPGGLGALSEKIHALGLLFGLWVEPEMVSPDSGLYRAHPDWCIHAPGRLRMESRHQLILDLSREEAREHLVKSVSAALERGNVDYVKWDMNRNFCPYGSAALPAERQDELGHRYMLGLYEVMDRITSRFPNLLFESCASGGGRFDFGVFRYMPQGWTSDDSDALERAKIQYASSLLFPPCAMGAHVSAVPNHQTGRVTPLFSRAAVAMGGTYGYELDLNKLSPAELEEIASLNRRVKALQPLMLYGDFYRLLSPFEENEAAFMVVSQDKREALVTHLYALSKANTKPGLLRLKGLDPARDYRDEDTNLVYGGDELMYRGVPLPPVWGDFMATQFHLTEA